VKRYVDRHATLTARGGQVLHLVAQGRLNKQIAFQLGITEVTVKLHRSSVMRKMEATSIGELIQGWNMLPSALRADPS
jgi:FixJ family two-component response regulator